MKKRASLSVILTLIFSLLLAACSGGSGIAPSEPADSTDKGTEAPAEPPKGDSGEAPVAQEVVNADDPNNFVPALAKDIQGEITVWAAWPLESWIGQFNSQYPNVKVNMVIMDEIEGKLKTALAAGSGAPDIAFLDGGLMGNYNTIEGFEDLLQPPYNAGIYEKYFPPSVWQRFKSLDGHELISIATDTAPAVTFYRADILEENGFPTDPAELGQYITDTDNFINMAKTLQAQDKYLIQWDTEPLNIYTFGIGFFNRKLEWQRNTDQFVAGLDLSKRFKQEKLASNIDFWSDEGTQALASGKTVMRGRN